MRCTIKERESYLAVRWMPVQQANCGRNHAENANKPGEFQTNLSPCVVPLPDSVIGKFLHHFPVKCTSLVYD